MTSASYVRRPNIVFVLADDMGYSDVGYHKEGSGRIPTPFMDSLSESGVRFSRHYVQPVCTPTRASLMTGRYAANTGLVWPMVPGCPAGLPGDMDTLPKAMKRLGYRTSMSGKHHLGHAQWKQTPSGIGFDEFVGCYMWDIDSYKKQMYENPWRPLTLDWVQTYPNKTYRHFAEPRHATEAITSEAQRMISFHREQYFDQPLFLYVAYTAAHSPLQPMPRHETNCLHIKHLWRRQFCGMVAGLDEGMRNLTQTILSDLGSDTILIFSSDNGGSTWFGGLNYPYRGGKSTPLEGGVRVPAFAVDFSDDSYFLGEGNWTYDGMIHVSDWFPTLLSAAGGKIDSFLQSGGDGLDMLNALRSRSQHGHRQEALLEMYDAENFLYNESLVAYVLGDLKLIDGVIRDPLYYYEADNDSINNTDTTLTTSLGQIEIRLGEAIFGSGPFDTSRVVITHSRIHARLSEIGQIDNRNGSRLLLFNLSADPTESINIASQYPDIVEKIKFKIEAIRARRPIQQKFWLQSHLVDDWPQTFVRGDCSMNPDIPADECHFTHPWVPDDKDPWEQPLIDGKQYSDIQLERALHGLIAGVFILMVLITVSSWFLFCSGRKDIGIKRSKNPK